MLTSCTHCNEIYDVENSKFGQEISCEKCSKVFRVMMYTGDKRPSPPKKQENKKKTKTCPSCKIKVPDNAKFCLECGSNLVTPATPIKKEENQEFKVPGKGITIQFAESTAAMFETALSYAKESAPSYQEIKVKKKSWHYATWPQDQMIGAARLAENLKGLRNRKVYIEGKETPWKEVFNFLWCIQSRKQAYRPNEYCFGLDDGSVNIWGCVNSNMEWKDWAKWFSYGTFKNKTKFVFDKGRIRHELENNLYKYRYCPYFSSDFVEIVFNLLPDSVSVSEKGAWGYKRCYDEILGAIKIVKKEKRSGYTMTDEFFSDGVSPKDLSEAKKILTKAFKQFGKNRIDPSRLIS